MRISKLFRRASIPCAGVALGFAALGNLLQSYAEAFHILCGLISLFFVVLLIGKLLVDGKSLRKAMGNPIQASVAGTLSMAIMLLSTYIAAQAHVVAFVIWVAAVYAHITLIVWFTRQYFLKSFKLERVFASYFIVYVGIVVASVTAPAFGMQSFGNVAFWFGLACFVALLFPVTKRYVQVKETPQAALPIFCIYAAPASLCVAGYVQSGQPEVFAAGICPSCYCKLHLCGRTPQAAKASEASFLSELCLVHLSLCHQRYRDEAGGRGVSEGGHVDCLAGSGGDRRDGACGCTLPLCGAALL